MREEEVFGMHAASLMVLPCGLSSFSTLVSPEVSWDQASCSPSPLTHVIQAPLREGSLRRWWRSWSSHIYPWGLNIPSFWTVAYWEDQFPAWLFSARSSSIFSVSTSPQQERAFANKQLVCSWEHRWEFWTGGRHSRVTLLSVLTPSASFWTPLSNHQLPKSHDQNNSDDIEMNSTYVSGTLLSVIIY